MATQYVYVPFNSRPEKGRPYFAIGGVHWSATGARNFMGNAKEWTKYRQKGWKIVKCKLTATPRSRTHQ